MLKGILFFEWRYATRRLTFLGAALLFGLMGFALAATGFGPDDVHVNGPYSVALSSGFLSLVSVFALTIVCAPSLLRDVEHQMAEIVYATSVTRSQYLFGRFAGSFLAACTAFVCAPLGLVAGALLGGHDPARIGPFHALDYLWPLLVLVLPNMLFVAALLLAVAATTRSTLATYVSGVFVYVLYFATALFTSSPLMARAGPITPETMALAALLDPFGLSAFFEQTHYWTAAERDLRRLVLRGHFLQNRVLWITLTALVLGVTHRAFAFRVLRRQDGAGLEAASERRGSGVPYRPATVRAERMSAQWAAWWSATRLEVQFLTRSWPFAALLMLWVGGAAVEMVQTFRQAEFGSALHPTTGLLLRESAASLSLFGLLMLVYYAAESVWRERAVRISDVVDATPVSSAVFLASKLTALGLLVGCLITVAVVEGMIFQLLVGYRAVEPGLFASLFYFTGLPLVLLAVVAVLVQTFCPNRHLGLVATLVAAVVWHRGALGGPAHPLLRFASAPEIPYSALAGFSPAALSFHWFMGYWTAFASLLALVAYGLWRRGFDPGLTVRLAALPRRWGRHARLGALASGVFCATLGAAVFYQTNVLNAYESGEDLLSWKADYERTYQHLQLAAQPSIVHVSGVVALFPEERRYQVRGRYTLENRTQEAVHTVSVAVRRDVAAAAVSVAGHWPASTDTRFGIRTFQLDTPLAPGGQTYLDFDITVTRRGAQADGADSDILPNGSFILSTAVFPSVGYRRSYEIGDATQRRRRGLADRGQETTADEAAEAGVSTRNDDRITFEVTVSTPADQTVIAPGVRLGSWEKEGRRYATFDAVSPVRPYLGFASARYAVQRTRRSGVDVEVYHHPGHADNVPRILDAATRSLDYFTAHFGPYPYPALRIAEVPSYTFGAGGLALPGVVYLVEDRAFLTDLRDETRVDIVTKRVAHEVAHQWWGHQVAPVAGPGGLALVETLARYSELLILKEAHGSAAWPPVLEVELDRYLSGRTTDEEVPLARVLDQGYLSYSKGALVMAAMHDLIGEEAVNGVLRTLLTDVREGRTPTAALLVDRLRNATPESQRRLVDEWWNQVVLYDLRVEQALSQRLPDGRYRLTTRLWAAKALVSAGQESPSPLDESVDVAVFADYPDAAHRGAANVLHFERHHVTGPGTLDIVLDERPGYVAIDPFVRRIDRNRTDNLRSVEAAPR